MKQFAKWFSVKERPIVIDTKADTCSIVDKVVAAHTQALDEFVIKSLYETYKKTEVSKLFIIDICEFEKFLKKYLPIYKEECK